MQDSSFYAVLGNGRSATRPWLSPLSEGSPVSLTACESFLDGGCLSDGPCVIDCFERSGGGFMRRACFVFAALVALAPVFGCGGEEPPPATPKPVDPTPPPPMVHSKPDAPDPPKPTMAELQKAAIQEALKGLNGQDP